MVIRTATFGLCRWARCEFGGRLIRGGVDRSISKLNFDSHSRVTSGILAELPDIVWDQNIFKAMKCNSSTIC